MWNSWEQNTLHFSFSNFSYGVQNSKICRTWSVKELVLVRKNKSDLSLHNISK